MPQVTEGLDRVVRTHRIESPNVPDRIEKAGLNACNLCHLDKSVRWTLDSLEAWYGPLKYDAELVQERYGSWDEPVGKVWFRHPNEAVRLSAAGAVKRESADWLLEDVARQLDSPRLINRQFAQDAVATLLDKSLEQSYGYRFWMTPEERRPALDRIFNAVRKQ
jgi:hypothetical protein